MLLRGAQLASWCIIDPAWRWVCAAAINPCRRFRCSRSLRPRCWRVELVIDVQRVHAEAVEGSPPGRVQLADKGILCRCVSLGRLHPGAEDLATVDHRRGHRKPPPRRTSRRLPPRFQEVLVMSTINPVRWRPTIRKRARPARHLLTFTGNRALIPRSRSSSRSPVRDYRRRFRRSALGTFVSAGSSKLRRDRSARPVRAGDGAPLYAPQPPELCDRPACSPRLVNI